jgi:hypothetical protein
VLRSCIKPGDAGEWFQFILLVPYSTHLPKAFLQVFLRKTKGKKSAGSDDEWAKLAEQVDEYDFKAGSDRRDDIDSNDASDLEQTIEDDDNNIEGNELVNTELDREQEGIDDSAVDECE